MPKIPSDIFPSSMLHEFKYVITKYNPKAIAGRIHKWRYLVFSFTGISNDFKIRAKNK